MDKAIDHIDTQKIVAFIRKKNPGIMERVSLMRITQDWEDASSLILDFRYKEKQNSGLNFITAIIVLSPGSSTPIDLPIFEQTTAPSN